MQAFTRLCVSVQCVAWMHTCVYIGMYLYLCVPQHVACTAEYIFILYTCSCTVYTHPNTQWCTQTYTKEYKSKNKKYISMKWHSESDAKNMFWSQCFNQNLGPAIVVLAALDTRAASTTTAGPKVVQPVWLNKFWLKHCDQGIFLHSILSATSFK